MGTLFSGLKRLVSSTPKGAQKLAELSKIDADNAMSDLIQELLLADTESKKNISGSIDDLYLSISTNFRTVAALRLAPAADRQRFVDTLLEMQGLLAKTDKYAWAVCRLFNLWVKSSILGEEETAHRYATELAGLTWKNRFPPE